MSLQISQDKYTLFLAQIYCGLVPEAEIWRDGKLVAGADVILKLRIYQI